MCALLKHTKHKKFFTQEEFEANKGNIYRINSAADTLTKNLKEIEDENNKNGFSK